MVTGEQGNISKFLRVFIPVQILPEEAVDIAAGIFLEITGIMFVIVIISHQCAVTVDSPVIQIEIHVKTGTQRLLRITPFGNHRGLRKLQIQHPAHITPNHTGPGFLFIITFYERIRHIHAETVTAMGKPEPHHVFYCFPCLQGNRVIHGKLPGFRRMQKTVIQSRLALEEVQYITGVPLRFPTNIGHAGSAVQPEICPDITVTVFVPLRLLALPEPGMFFRCMTGNQIQQYMDPLFVSLIKQAIEVFIRPVAWRYLFVVPHIITGILERRIITGIDPQSVAAQILDVIQFRDDPVDIPDSVAVRVTERLRINFIKYSVFQPLGPHPFLLGSYDNEKR